MQRIIYLLLMGLLTINVCNAQFSATGGANGTPYVIKPAGSTGLDQVFVFDGLDNAKISLKADRPSEWIWYSYKINPNDAVAVPASDVQTTSTETILSNVQTDCGYMVVSEAGVKAYVYVVGYFKFDGENFKPTADCDVCHTLEFLIPANDGFVYYTTTGRSVTIKRLYNITWNTLNWNSTDKSYNTKEMSSSSVDITDFSIDAPLTDTYFYVTGDQFADYFGKTYSFKSEFFKTVAVKTNASAELLERTADNELDKVSSSGDLSGSAPLNINFSSNANDAVSFYEWLIYESADDTGNYKRYTDENISPSFQETGTFLVKLNVSNSSCKDSATFSPQVLVSYIDCPNFFTPRSSPGENDEFRVAYKSIISFKGIIINRWGNILFEWTDPALGWNGTYKGKAVSPGVYFYLIEAKGSDGVVYKKKGDINLLE